MGIPNLAHRRRHGQEWQSRCKLATSKLAIYVGYHEPVGMRQTTGRSRRIAVAAHTGFSRGLLVIKSQGRLRDPDGDSILRRAHLERVLYFNHSSFC